MGKNILGEAPPGEGEIFVSQVGLWASRFVGSEYQKAITHLCMARMYFISCASAELSYGFLYVFTKD